MYEIKDGLVYEPADLGFNATNLPAAGVIVNGLPVPWIEVYPWKRITIIRELGVGSGTPMTLDQQGIGPRGVQWSDGLVNSGLWTAITNNPRTQWFLMTLEGIGNVFHVATTGGSVGPEVAKLFGNPWIRFAAQNNDPAVAASLTLTAICRR